MATSLLGGGGGGISWCHWVGSRPGNHLKPSVLRNILYSLIFTWNFL